MHKDNKDARELYYRGVHDTIEAIEVWAKNAPVDSLGVLLERLYEQTDADKDDLVEYQSRGAVVLNKRYCALFVDMGLGKQSSAKCNCAPAAHAQDRARHRRGTPARCV